MKQVQTLIAMARAKCHTDAELAGKLGETKQNFHGMKTGRRPITNEHIATMCDMLQLPGEEAREWLAINAIEQAARLARPGAVEVLSRALFACWALGVVALTTLTSNDAQAREDAPMTACIDAGNRGAVTDLQRTVYTLSRIATALCRALRLSIRGVAPDTPRRVLFGS